MAEDVFTDLSHSVENFKGLDYDVIGELGVLKVKQAMRSENRTLILMIVFDFLKIIKILIILKISVPLEKNNWSKQLMSIWEILIISLIKF